MSTEAFAILHQSPLKFGAFTAPTITVPTLPNFARSNQETFNEIFKHLHTII
jgi:hypothetical protein